MSMKRILISLGSVGAVVCFSGVAQAQWDDNFDGYANGSNIVGQGDWLGWWDDPGASNAVVSSAEANSGPHSLATIGPDDTVQLYSGFGGGVWVYETMVYHPSDMTGLAYFIMLNQFDNVDTGQGGVANWSTQMSFDANGGTVNSEFENLGTDLVTDTWVHLRVLIDLDNDIQSITYNNEYVTQKSWSEGTGGAGLVNIAAVDLWANNASVHYYDDLSLTEADTIGACCLPDGACVADVDMGTCEGDGGSYQGDGSTCAVADATLACLAIGDCGTILNLPDVNGSNFNIKGSTCDEENSCNLVSSSDFQAEINLPFDAEWTIAICGSSFDTLLRIGTDCCTADIASLDDGCGAVNLQESFTDFFTAGTYFVTIEGVGGGCGAFELDISTACVLDAKGASDEGEPNCGQDGDENDGCNDPDGDGFFNFGTVSCGETIAGTLSFIPGVYADTDWYELVVEENTTVTVTQQGDGSGINFGFIQYNEGFEGSGDCSQTSGFVSPFSTATGCQVGDVSSDLTPGIWWIWTALPFQETDPAQDCPTNYVLTVSCDGGAECTWDLSEDGTVNGTDLILLLGAWGDPYGTPDLIELLGAWGDCE